MLWCWDSTISEILHQRVEIIIKFRYICMTWNQKAPNWNYNFFRTINSMLHYDLFDEIFYKKNNWILTNNSPPFSIFLHINATIPVFRHYGFLIVLHFFSMSIGNTSDPYWAKSIWVVSRGFTICHLPWWFLKKCKYS